MALHDGVRLKQNSRNGWRLNRDDGEGDFGDGRTVRRNACVPHELHLTEPPNRAPPFFERCLGVVKMSPEERDELIKVIREVLAETGFGRGGSAPKRH